MPSGQPAGQTRPPASSAPSDRRRYHRSCARRPAALPQPTQNPNIAPVSSRKAAKGGGAHLGPNRAPTITAPEAPLLLAVSCCQVHWFKCGQDRGGKQPGRLCWPACDACFGLVQAPARHSTPLQPSQWPLVPPKPGVGVAWKLAPRVPITIALPTGRRLRHPPSRTTPLQQCRGLCMVALGKVQLHAVALS